MKQIMQNLKTGAVELVDVPTPLCRPGHLLVATRRSLISAGTERTLVEFGRSSLLGKARKQPDRVRQVLDKVRTDGLLQAAEAVFSRLDQPLPLGYCNVGEVLEVGEGVTEFAVGDRVASNGPHAEVVCVPERLCVPVPDEVSDDEAAFTVLGAVGLQGIRLAAPALGERVAVIGLGLIGLMTVQMLAANGCRVLGIDFDPHKLELARQFGAQTMDLTAGRDPVIAGMTFSDGQGVDAVLITASTASNEPVRQAAQMSRKRGRIVLVGVAGLELSRDDFYEKELSFQVSCSYGPGRYDRDYEEKGHDYPFGFVRWTEQRNFQAVLQLIGGGKLQVLPLVSQRVPQAEALGAYDLLLRDHSILGILLEYPDSSESRGHTVRVSRVVSSKDVGQVVVGVIGAGSFASRVLLPALARTPARVVQIASASGASAAHAARKFGIEEATSDYRAVLENPDINTVFIVTRHNTHAPMVVQALSRGKHVFVEKPLAIDRSGLAAVKQAFDLAESRQLMVGFNRRFAPLAVEMHSLLAGRSQPVNVVYTVNAGAIPPDHWTQDPKVGGGRIIGEACHFVDLIRYLVGHSIMGVGAQMIGDAHGVIVREDKMTLLLELADGSTGTVHYLANGSRRYPKERIEVFSEGRVLVLANFMTLRGYGWEGFGHRRLWRQDKGHVAEVRAFVERVQKGGNLLISWDELEEVTLATFAAVERAADGLRPIE